MTTEMGNETVELLRPSRNCGDKGMTCGRDDLMAIAAVRYCLGRMTYIVSDCADWLIEVWPNLKPSARNIIQRDVEEAFAMDDQFRENGNEYKPLGMGCDRQQWERVRRLWK